MGLLILITFLAAIGIWLVREKRRLYKFIGGASLSMSFFLIAILINSYDVSKGEETQGTANLNISKISVELQK